MSNELPDDKYELKCGVCKKDILYSQYIKTWKNYRLPLCEECAKSEEEIPF